MASTLTTTLLRLRSYVATCLTPTGSPAKPKPLDTSRALAATATRAPAESQQCQSPFFQLPGEIREMIYRHYLAFTWDTFHTARSDGPGRLQFYDQQFARPLPALVRACKRLYREMWRRCQLRAAFLVYHLRWLPFVGLDTIFGIAVHGPLRLPQLRTLVVVVNSQCHANWTWGQHLFTLLWRATQLRELIFELYAVPGQDVGMTRWRTGQEEELVQALKKLPQLEVVRFRGDVSDHLLERMAFETRAKVLRSELSRCWTLTTEDQNTSSWITSLPEVIINE